MIDPYVFGDITSFREQFINSTDEVTRNVQLKQRIAPICARSLRKQVAEYIPFTNRVPMMQEFLPTNEEQALYDDITTYLQRDILYALPASQRQLITMVLRKLLASSTFAIARTLRRLADRLESFQKNLNCNAGDPPATPAADSPDNAGRMLALAAVYTYCSNHITHNDEIS